MKSLDLTDKEITYLLVSLRRYEENLLTIESEDLEDTSTDLLFVQSLIGKLKASKS